MLYKTPLVDVVTFDSWLVFITYSASHNILGKFETISSFKERKDLYNNC